MQLVEMSGCQVFRDVELSRCSDDIDMFGLSKCRDAELSRCLDIEMSRILSCQGKTLNRLPVGSKAFWK